MSFRRKPYPEVAESLLNRLLGGVSAEQHPYPPARATREPFAHALERSPVDSLTAVWGARNGESQRFERGTDYELSSDATQIVWKSGGQRPDEGTAFEVHYLPKQRDANVNDLYPGSVVRTMLEAVALETAGLYAQMEAVYRSGFVDTARGGALDHVVALLGVARVRAGRNSGELRFTRARNTRGEITIPAGTRVLTADGKIEYETLDDLTLADGQPTGKVNSRDIVATNDGLAADSLTLVAKPIAGIESVTNPAATTRLDRDENDDELRLRAKHFLAGSERGTLGAIAGAVAGMGLKAEAIEPPGAPGLVRVQVHESALDPERRALLERRVAQVRPAGVRVELDYGTAPVKVDIAMRLTSAAGLLDIDLRRIQSTIGDRFKDYFDRLPSTSDGSISKLIGLAMGVEGVEDARLTAATVNGGSITDLAAGTLLLASQPTRLGELSITDPSLSTGLTLSVRYPRDAAIPDAAAISSAVEAALAYLNDLAVQAIPADAPKRSLSWGKLTRVLPLPHGGWVSGTLQAQESGTPTPATAGDVGPYTVQWTFTRPSGTSVVLGAPADAPFALTTEERLSVARIAVEVKPKVP